MRPPEVLISYSDILAEKSLSSEEVRVILDAANVYISERGAPLKQETVDTALGLNRKLIQLEIEVVEKCRKLDEEIRQKILEGMDISDYEIEAFFGFYLKEDDPYSYDGAAFWNCIYNQDDCAIVAEVTDNGKMALSENHYGIGSSLDFCDMHGSARLAPLCSERHCWLFRQLHDRCQIPFSHMQRIGEVWTDIRLVYQKQWALV